MVMAYGEHTKNSAYTAQHRKANLQRLQTRPLGSVLATQEAQKSSESLSLPSAE